MMTKEQYLTKIGKTEEALHTEGLELRFIGEIGYDDDDGWEVIYRDQSCDVEVGMGCKCSTGGTLHDKL
ncbi:MAG: hypothetical protein ACRCZ9_10480 [Fusobacteriaceae bacterium]